MKQHEFTNVVQCVVWPVYSSWAYCTYAHFAESHLSNSDLSDAVNGS